MQKDLLPAAFSFCLPGLGQLYQGRQAPAVLLFAAFIGLCFLSFGRYLLPAMAILAAFEAFLKTPDGSRAVARSRRRVTLYGSVGVIGLLAWMGVASPVFLPVGALLEVQQSADTLSKGIQRCQASLGRRPAKIADCPSLVAERLNDPWGTAFEYLPTDRGFQLISRGRDRQLGTSDDFRFTFH